MDSMNEVERKIENIVGAVYNHGFLTAKEGTERLLKSPNTEMPIAVAKQELKSLIQEERQGAVESFLEDFTTAGIYEGCKNNKQVMEVWRKNNV